MDGYWTSDEEYSDLDLPLPTEILKKVGDSEKLEQLLQLYGKTPVPGSVPIPNPETGSQIPDPDAIEHSLNFDFNEVDSNIYTFDNNAPELYNFGGQTYISDGLVFKSISENIKEYPICPDEHIKQPEKKASRLIRLNWAVVDDGPVNEIPEDQLLIEYPFDLDTFQKKAIYHVSKGKHVFVAAHTSAGKTVIAEYAIAVALSKGRKAVYTSPIKALSNQKYREFKNTFDSVGIITGDVCCNPSASCLVMTTEILRNLLYRGDSLIGELDVVIFDEVHYISDLSRGVVWEEVIIMLPKVLQLIMLSATVPNYIEFSDWIGRTMQREVVAVVTRKRPTPLVHYLHIHSKNFLLLNSSGFNHTAYHQMYSYAKTLSLKKKGKVQKPKSSTPEGEIQKLQALIKSLEQNDKLPVILFTFSRAKCEAYARCMPKLDLSKTQSERSKIHLFLKESLDSLSENDRNIPQLQFTISLLERGVGVHHSGLLPIVKEIVEILFSRGLVKVLFATETFAMGVNMPARSVVFTSIRKHDGIKNRALTSSEYTQMAGRAGRRGLDSQGNVFIFCVEDPPDLQDLTAMMVEKSTPLKSQFRITYSMLLQVMSRDHMSIEELMSKSFLERNRAKKMPVYKRDIFRRRKELESIGEISCIYGNPTIREYRDLELKSRETLLPVTKLLWNSKTNIISPGRLLRLHSIAYVSSYCIGVVISLKDTLTCLIALPDGYRIRDGGVGISILFSASLLDHKVSYYLISGILEKHVSGILDSYLAGGALNSTLEDLDINSTNSDILELAALSLISCDITHSLVSFPKGLRNVPLDIYDKYIIVRELNSRIVSNQCHTCELREEHFEMSLFRGNCEREIEEISSWIKESSLETYPEMQARLSVLKRMGFLDSDNVPTIKGRVATYVTTTDEIGLTEALFQNVLKDLDAQECAAILSVFISADKSTEEAPVPTPGLRDAREKIVEIHRGIHTLQASLGVRTQGEDELYSFSLLYVCYRWATGTPFPEILESTDLREGNIVRAIIRLDELCRKIEHVAILMQDNELADKMQKTSDCIKRDIAFSTSLYLK